MKEPSVQYAATIRWGNKTIVATSGNRELAEAAADKAARLIGWRPWKAILRIDFPWVLAGALIGYLIALK
jgi:ABC-type Fe3+ transport system permease subunit